MKVAFVTTNLRGGGAEKAILKLATALSGRGHEVHLFLIEHVIDHPCAATLHMHALSRPGKSVAKGFFGKWLAAWKLARMHRHFECDAAFDVTVSTLPFADEVVALARLPRVWYRIANTLSAEIAVLREHNPRKAARRLLRYRRLYSGRNLIGVSEGVAQDLRDGIGVRHANIVRIYNLFDVDGIRSSAAELDLDVPPQPYVMHIGRFVPQKRHDLLFEAFKTLPSEYKLVLLVKSSAALVAMLVRFGIADRTVIAGFHTNPYPWIKQAKLLVLCSDHEGLPNVLIESLICGTPVVSTDCPSGPREILEGIAAGTLVPCGDTGALSRAMLTALAAGRAAYLPNFDKYSATCVLRQFEDLPQLWRQPA